MMIFEEEKIAKSTSDNVSSLRIIIFKEIQYVYYSCYRFLYLLTFKSLHTQQKWQLGS